MTEPTPLRPASRSTYEQGHQLPDWAKAEVTSKVTDFESLVAFGERFVREYVGPTGMAIPTLILATPQGTMPVPAVGVLQGRTLIDCIEDVVDHYEDRHDGQRPAAIAAVVSGDIVHLPPESPLGERLKAGEDVTVELRALARAGVSLRVEAIDGRTALRSWERVATSDGPGELVRSESKDGVLQTSALSYYPPS